MTEPSRSADLLIGVDGGGTATSAWLADSSGQILGRGSSGASNIKSAGAEQARKALDRAIESAFADAAIARTKTAIACLGLAGFDRPEDQDVLRTWNDQLCWAHKLLLVNDGELVIAAGTPEGWGIGLIAGTGSIAVGRSRSGRTSRAGGWGHIFGDEGSAYGVAVAGLRLAARRHDGRSAKPNGRDILSAMFCSELGINKPEQLVTAIYQSQRDRAAIAALARLVAKAAEAGDDEAAALILEPAGRELAEAAAAVARSLELDPSETLPLALAGGFVLATDRVRIAILSHLHALGFHVQPYLVEEPVAGAVILARNAYQS